MLTTVVGCVALLSATIEWEFVLDFAGPPAGEVSFTAVMVTGDGRDSLEVPFTVDLAKADVDAMRKMFERQLRRQGWSSRREGDSCLVLEGPAGVGFKEVAMKPALAGQWAPSVTVKARSSDAGSVNTKSEK